MNKVLKTKLEELQTSLNQLNELNLNLTKLLNNEQKKLTKKEQIIKDLKAKVSELEEANIQANQKIMSIQKDYIELANEKIKGVN